MIEFMAITNDVETGTLWHAAGVDRIMIDLETFGKAERQRHRDTVKSDHSVTDIGAMRQAMPDAHIVVRCEPVTLPGWSEHIQRVVEARPTSVMLPMVESADDVRVLCDAVESRADLIVMVETAAALTAIEEIVTAAPHATIFVGLNDLHIQLGHRFMFEPLADGQVELVAEATSRAGARFGFGGLARARQGLVDSAAVVKEHVRLGSCLAILSRSFFNDVGDPHDDVEISAAIQELREVDSRAQLRSADERCADSRSTRDLIHRVATQLADRA